MKYTQEERIEIGRDVYTSGMSCTEAMAKYSQKEVLQLVFIEDMPKSKTAEELGISCARVTEIIKIIRER